MDRLDPPIDLDTGEFKWGYQAVPLGRFDRGTVLNVIADFDGFEGTLQVLPGGSGGVVTPIAEAGCVVYVPVVNAPITNFDPADHAWATPIHDAGPGASGITTNLTLKDRMPAPDWMSDPDPGSRPVPPRCGKELQYDDSTGGQGA